MGGCSTYLASGDESFGYTPRVIHQPPGNIAVPLDTYSHLLPGIGGGTVDGMDDALESVGERPIAGAPYSPERVATLYLNNWLKVRETRHMGAVTSSGTA